MDIQFNDLFITDPEYIKNLEDYCDADYNTMIYISHQQNKIFSEDEGDYVDFEEVDNKPLPKHQRLFDKVKKLFS